MSEIDLNKVDFEEIATQNGVMVPFTVYDRRKDQCVYINPNNKIKCIGKISKFSDRGYCVFHEKNLCIHVIVKENCTICSLANAVIIPAKQTIVVNNAQCIFVGKRSGERCIKPAWIKSSRGYCGYHNRSICTHGEWSSVCKRCTRNSPGVIEEPVAPQTPIALPHHSTINEKNYPALSRMRISTPPEIQTKPIPPEMPKPGILAYPIPQKEVQKIPIPPRDKSPVRKSSEIDKKAPMEDHSKEIAKSLPIISYDMWQTINLRNEIEFLRRRLYDAEKTIILLKEGFNKK